MKIFFQKMTHHPLFWIALLFLTLPFLAFPELIWGGKTLYWTDLSWIHYPRHIFAASEWLAGRVPLWDPYEDTGIPLLAESQVGVLYPFSLLFLSSLSPSLELSLFIMLHFPLAAFFTVLLARSMGLSWAAAAVAGLAYGFGGFLMGQVPNLNIMTGAAWLPLILYGVIQTIRQRSRLMALLAGLPLALQIFTSQPQIVFYTLVMMVSYGAYRLPVDFFSGMGPVSQKLKYAAHTLLLLAVVIIAGLLLAAPQLLPTLELQQLSVRSQERGFEFLTENSLPPAMWLNLLLPGAFGNNVVGFEGGDPFQEDFIYAGFISLVLVFFAWPQRRKRDALFFVFLLIGAGLLAAGQYTPLYQTVIQYLPGFDLFRIPSRWLMGVNLALAVLAGLGMDAVLQRSVSRRALAILIGMLVLLVVGGLIWRFSVEPQHKLTQAILDKAFTFDEIYRQRLWPSFLVGLSTPAALLGVNIILTVALFSLYAFRRLSRQSFAILLILVLALELAAAGGTTINPTKPAEWWQELSGGAQYVLDNAGEARVFPLGMGSEAAAVSHLGQYFPSVYRVRSAGGHGSSLLMARYNTFLHEADPVQAIQVVGAKYLLTLGQMGADVAATYPLVYSEAASDEMGASFVYENPNPLPRAFIVHDVVPANSPEEALGYLQGRSINPAETVVLETDAELPAPAAPPEGVTGTATIIDENPQMIRLKANLTADGYLVLLDTFYPGWVATVDGTPTPIYRANTIGRAVLVPAGEHEIVFSYKPISFRMGVWLSVGVLVTLGIAALLTWQKHRSKPDSAPGSPTD